VAGHLPICDLALGCAGHYRASAHARPQASAQRNPLEARSADRGGAVVLTFPAQEGSARWPAHRSIIRRRRAQGHGLSRGYELSRATSHATQLACGLAQSAVVRGHSRARARATSPCPLGRPFGVQRRSTRRGGGASTVPCTTIHGSTAGSHTSSSHGDDGAQGHAWPRSSFPSRCGSSAARRPAHRQGKHGDAS
jgi:hypothetical protein